MTRGSALPGPFFRFIGVTEVLGGIGLILPFLLRISPFLTPVAACGLVIIMAGATATSIPMGLIAVSIFIRRARDRIRAAPSAPPPHKGRATSGRGFRGCEPAAVFQSAGHWTVTADRTAQSAVQSAPKIIIEQVRGEEERTASRRRIGYPESKRPARSRSFQERPKATGRTRLPRFF
jgi:hypothetical protein